MKNLLKQLVAGILALLAGVVVAKYRPKIVMITGSVGKTSTKDAVAAALSSRFFVRASEKSYNTEFGVPLTIFGAKNPWRSSLGWFRVIREALALILLPNHYPNLLVLEVGADRPGDLPKTLRIVIPDVVIVTRLPDVPVHVEAYASPEAVREEEFAPAYALPPGAPLIVSADDEHAVRMSARIAARLITYGTKQGAEVRIEHPHFVSEGGMVAGMEARLHTPAGEAPLFVRSSVGNVQLLPAAAAIAAALALNVALPEALEGLRKYMPPPGRGRILRGKNDSVLIDDTYNASPAAVEEALATLKAFPSTGRKIAVLGDMLELGRYSIAEHARIATIASEVADIVIGVGVRARAICDTYCYDSGEKAAETLLGLLQPGDVVLLKGSQSVRLERVVERLLADANDTAKLVRQEKEWRRR